MNSESNYHRIHLVKPNSHTGNGDIERLNNTITEMLRLLNIEENAPITDLLAKAIEKYNRTYHSSIRTTPYNT